MTTALMLVGGFLGAGKTTLLGQAAQRLAAQGRRVGLITNDQAPQLVDTGLLQSAGFAVREIAGGCFCCRFADLIATSQTLVARLQPEILIAEPVGSCTDLSATVIQPLKDRFAAEFDVRPFSVLVDPHRLQEALDPRLPSPLHASARYILRKQLEDADLLVLNKVDLLAPDDLDDLRYLLGDRFPETPICEISALTGEGVETWLQRALAHDPAGRRLAEVDYDIYAEGEAVLGWLNATARLTADGEVDWRAWCDRLLARFQGAVRERGCEVAHIKLMLTTESGQYLGNLTSTAGAPSLRGTMPGNPSSAELVFNARVQMDPEALRQLFLEILHDLTTPSITVIIQQCDSLSPGRPQPTYRYSTLAGEGLPL